MGIHIVYGARKHDVSLGSGPNLDITSGYTPISRRKSFKKSLRESFRRLRKGRSRITDISSTYQAELERGGHLDVQYGGWVEEVAYPNNGTGWEYSPEEAFVTIDLPLPPDIMDMTAGSTSKKTTLV
ncbi:hypothetical protein WDU94_007469 [Cyamophila willieti]